MKDQSDKGTRSRVVQEFKFTKNTFHDFIFGPDMCEMLIYGSLIN